MYYNIEKWITMPNHPNYKISTFGRYVCVNTKSSIYSSVREPSKPCSDGYVHVSFNNKSYLLHRAVAIAFLPNPDNKPEVNHKDLNKTNNHLSNLEWVTRSENMQHSDNMRRSKGLRCRKEPQLRIEALARKYTTK